MGKLDKLLEIIGGVVEGFKLPENVSVDGNKFSVDISLFKHEQPVVYNAPVLQINADTPEGKVIAQKIFENAEQLLNKDERAVESDFGSLIAEAVPAAPLQSDDQQLLKSFKEFIPPGDISIVEAALFIRRVYLSNGHVSRYKQLISQKYGSRGTNISNLVSADYYENYLVPIYTHLKAVEPEYAVSIFSDIYEEAVTQYPFAVFVSMSKSLYQIKDEILNKIQLNLLNGQHVLNIHGIGSMNKKKITELLADEDICKFYVSEPDIVTLATTIFARVYF